MKKLILLAATIALALSFYSAKAQNIGAQDILIRAQNGNSIMGTEISVADNGWIYVLVQVGYNHEETKWELYRSQNEGVTYELILTRTSSGDWKLADCDIVVTGKNESDIAVWIAYIENNAPINVGDLTINKYDCNGNNITNALYKLFSTDKMYHVSIATDYRSPGYGGTPFSIGVATTQYEYEDSETYVAYTYSSNGGNDFKDMKWIYRETGEKSLRRIDVTLGSGAKHSFGRVGIVFEMNVSSSTGKGNIGFLANTTDYDNNLIWSEPIKVNKKCMETTGKCANPKIQWMCNKTIEMPDDPQAYSFLIAFEDYCTPNDADIMIIYPESSFELAYNHTPTLYDFGYYWFGRDNGKNNLTPALSYDKVYNNFMLTYSEAYKELGYKTVYYAKIKNENLWFNHGIYAQDTQYDINRWQLAIDINPAKTKACFAWCEEEDMGGGVAESIWADAEWSTVDVQERNVAQNDMTVSPNPATDKVKVKVKDYGNYNAVLYNMQGQMMQEFKFSGNEHMFNVEELSRGMYMLKVSDGKNIYKNKLIK